MRRRKDLPWPITIYRFPTQLVVASQQGWLERLPLLHRHGLFHLVGSCLSTLSSSYKRWEEGRRLMTMNMIRNKGEKSIMKKMKGNAVSGVLQRLFRPMKVSAAETEALHHLRMLHTRHMQWRLVNARSDRAMALREMSAQVQEAQFNIWDFDTCTQTNCLWWALETIVFWVSINVEACNFILFLGN